METRLDIERAFTFIFKDPKWLKKIGIGALLTLSILGIPAVIGWALETQRHVLAGYNENTLATWNSFGKYFLDGLKLLVGYILWLFLPLYFIIFVYFILTIGSSLIMNEAKYEAFSIYLFPTMINASPYIFYGALPFFSLFKPLISGLFLENKKIRVLSGLGQIIKLLKNNFRIALSAALTSIGLFFAFWIISIITFGIGFVILFPVRTAILYHLYGQAYRISKIKLGEYSP